MENTVKMSKERKHNADPLKKIEERPTYLVDLGPNPTRRSLGPTSGPPGEGGGGVALPTCGHTQGAPTPLV